MFREEWAGLKESAGMVKHSDPQQGGQASCPQPEGEEWEGAITGTRGLKPAPMGRRGQATATVQTTG